MTIKRAAPGHNPFTMILNEVITDKRLGADGLGVLVYLISKPATWEVKIGDLRKQFGIGRDKAYKLLSHLVDLGYAERYQGRDDSGGFSDNNYLIFDRIKPLPENTEAAPLPDLPDTVNPPLQKKERKQKKDIPYSEDFLALWEAYPRTKNTSKGDAWNIYRMLNAERQEMVRHAVPLYAAAMRAENRPDDKIKHMTSWLNGKFYETAAAPAPIEANGSTPPTKRFWEYATEKQWANVLLVWSTNWQWSESWGPAPDKPGCHVPSDLLDRFDLKYRGHLFSPEEKEAKKARVSQSRDGGSAAPPAV